jgi:hypothetical protein
LSTGLARVCSANRLLDGWRHRRRRVGITAERETEHEQRQLRVVLQRLGGDPVLRRELLRAQAAVAQASA